MTAPVDPVAPDLLVRPTDDHPLRRVARAVLTAAVRGRRERGGPWGEAVLAEFDRTTGAWEAVRWAAGGLRTAWCERRHTLRWPAPLRWLGRFHLGYALLALVAAVLVNQFVLTARYEPSGSMEPTLLIGDRFLVDRVSHHLTGVHRGDLVEFTWQLDGGDRNFVKRVIGLGGDVIECRDGRVWRNGSPVDEPYLGADPMDARTDCAAVTVPAGEAYVLGDHRLVSMDSRQLGPIPLDRIDGRVLFRIWPLRR